MVPSSVEEHYCGVKRCLLIGTSIPLLCPSRRSRKATISNQNGFKSLVVEMVYLGYILLMSTLRRDGGATRRGYDSRRKMGNGGCGRGKVGGL